MKLLNVCLSILLTSTVVKAEKPNILLILADDLGWSDVGFNGSKEITTPELDSLAKGGTTFSSAYVVHPFCGPSRMGLMSGRYPHTFGAPYNLPPYSSGNYREHGIGKDQTLMSTVLKDAGYYTGIVGKWHLGHQPEHHPNARGFDEFYGFLGGGILYFGPYLKQNEQGKIWDYKVEPEYNGKRISTLTKQDYMTDVLSAEGSKFIEKAAKSDKPFFLFMSYNAPHTMLEAKEEDIKRFPNLKGKRQTYAAMVYALDRGIGELVKTLKSTGEYENTLIIFFSDNGGRSDQGASNLPLKGVKGDALEGGYRTPMFFHWPKKVAAGKNYSHPVTALDFYPTFAGLAGAKIPASQKLDGVDIWEDFLADRTARKGGMIYCMRHRNGFSDIGARKDEWKILRTGMRGWKLFNVDKDISETTDLSAKHPEILKEMVAEAAKWADSHTQPLWFDNPKAEKKWKDAKMPRYDKLFEVK